MHTNIRQTHDRDTRIVYAYARDLRHETGRGSARMRRAMKRAARRRDRRAWIHTADLE